MSDSLMIITDLDGTIVGSGFGIGEIDKRSLELLSNQGVVLVAATGRNLHKTMEVLGEDSPFDYVVFSTGAGIYNNKTKEILKDSRIDSEIGKKIRELLAKQNENFLDYHPIPKNHHFDYYYSYDCVEYNDYISRYKKLDLACKGNGGTNRSSAQFMIIIPESKERFDKIKDYLESKLGDTISIIRATSPFGTKHIWVEIFPKGISKGSGIETLFKHTGLNRNNAMGIGNDYNDLDFLKILPHSFVVGNAPEELKKQFDVVPSVDESGFTSAVERFLIKKRGYGLLRARGTEKIE